MRLAGAGVVGQEEAQRLAGQHRLVHRRDLVRQRLHHGRVHRQHGIEQMREADALRFGDQPDQRPVAVEAPRPPLVDDFQAGLVMAVQQLVGDRAGRRLVRQLQRLRAEPLHADDRHCAVGMDAPDGAMGLKLFESHRRERQQGWGRADVTAA